MRSLLWTTLTIGMVVFFWGGSPLAAQEPPDGEALELAPEISFEGEVTVTGSLIPRSDLTALSPVTVMEVPTELTYSGTVRIEDLVTTMPQVFAGQNSTIANGATGTATINLRRLGSYRTLVLMNGRRMPPGDAWGEYAPDINVIPAPLVKRIDVLTGGASTTYGSDALAGVVNFILDTDFTGVRGGIQYAGYYHDNNNPVAQEINQDRGFEVPSGLQWDGDSINANVAVGGKFADGKGHASVYLDYRKIEALTKSARDYVNCSVRANPDGPSCGGSSITPFGTFLSYAADDSYNGQFRVGWISDGTGNRHEFVPRDATNDIYNFGPYNHIQRPDEKWNAGGFANYEINRHFDVYMEVMYMNNYTDAQIAPSGNFYSTDRINCDNPMLSAQQHDLICAGAGYADDEFAVVYIGRRNVEGGPRFNALGHTNIRLVGGLRGEIDDNWNYDFYYLMGQNNSQDSYVNDLNVSRIANALDVIEDPDTGEWVCRNERARAGGCVPWNIFQEGAVTQEAVDYISTVAVSYGKTSVQVFNLTFTSDWENYGITIPSASEGVQVAVGAEYREERLENQPDEVYRTGNAAGHDSPIDKIVGKYNVKEAFIEMLIPIVQDATGAQDLSLELGYRYSDYSTSGGVSTYKAQLSYAPSDSWRIRGGYNRAIRAPNIFELFSPQTLVTTSIDDPCGGSNPQATIEQCARTGVTLDQYGNIPEHPFETRVMVGGNPLLEPEEGDTLTAGVVWTPRSIRGLSVTTDYYDIRIEDVVITFHPKLILQFCSETGDPSYCRLVHRDALGSLWIDGYVDSSKQNLGNRSAKGIDLNANYLIGLGGAGYLATDLMGSYLLESRLQKENEFDFNCTGYFGSSCGPPRSVWRHRLRATWESNSRFNLSLAWRYLGGAENDAASPDPNLSDPVGLDLARANNTDTVRHYSWFDLAASYTFRNGIKLTLGINNILDEEPPLMPDYADDPYFNLYGSYDPLGRYIFGSVQFNF